MSAPDGWDRWIAGARRTERTVALYQRADLRADLDDLARALPTAEGQALADLDARWRDLRAQLDASALTVRVRALTAPEVAALTGGAPADAADLDQATANVIAAAVTDPPITPAQVFALRDAVGDAQLARLWQAVLAACSAPPEADGG